MQCLMRIVFLVLMKPTSALLRSSSSTLPILNLAIEILLVLRERQISLPCMRRRA